MGVLVTDPATIAECQRGACRCHGRVWDPLLRRWVLPVDRVPAAELVETDGRLVLVTRTERIAAMQAAEARERETTQGQDPEETK